MKGFQRISTKMDPSDVLSKVSQELSAAMDFSDSIDKWQPSNDLKQLMQALVSELEAQLLVPGVVNKHLEKKSKVDVISEKLLPGIREKYGANKVS